MANETHKEPVVKKRNHEAWRLNILREQEQEAKMEAAKVTPITGTFLQVLPEETVETIDIYEGGRAEPVTTLHNVIKLNSIPPNLRCDCGSEWWSILATFDQKTRIVNGYTSILKCSECGKEQDVNRR